MNDYEKLLDGLRHCSSENNRCSKCPYYSVSAGCIHRLVSDASTAMDEQRAEIVRLRADVARLEAESRAKEQYIAEHMGGTAERNARMRRDAERLRGTGTHAFADGGELVLKDKY